MYEDITIFSNKIEKTPHAFNVLMCGSSYCDGTYKINRPKSPICCIEYICKGRGYVTVDDVTFTASEGDIYLLPIGKDHFYYSDDKDPWEKLWFNISGKFVESTLEAYGIENIYHIKNLDLKSLFKDFLSHAEKIKQTSSTKFNFNACAMDYLKIIQSIATSPELQEKHTPTDKAELLKNKIDTLTDFSLTFDEILNEFFYTKSHLIRLFKAKYGITPYDYLLEHKLSIAKLLLKNTAIGIAEIASRLGFANSHYFSNFFSKKVGMSPREYRNTNNIQL
ncbi:MAG: AraC family transcriptional regulator [Clostridia bacterium]|nr:AraC family transcriptional regulator [Clostridia bacterium]